MSLQEKTLELNITHEILNLGLNFFVHHHLRGRNILHWPRPLRRIWPFIPHPIEYASGFHINLEGPKGGYDVALHYGRPGVSNSKAIFLQYKSPSYKAICTRGTVHFNGNRRIPTPHFQFFINTNGRQHAQLRKLARKQDIRYNGNYVLYALPLLRDEADFLSKLGSLVRHTKFITIRSIDNVARNQNPRVDIAIGEHSILVGRDDCNIVEVLSDVMVLGEQDISGDVIAEIITAIIRKNLLLLYNDKQNGKLLTYLMRDALPYLFYEYILYLLDYFEVDIDRVFEMDFFNDEERNRFRSYVSDVIQVANSKRVNNERDIRLLNAIAPNGNSFPFAFCNALE